MPCQIREAQGSRGLVLFCHGEKPPIARFLQSPSHHCPSPGRSADRRAARSASERPWGFVM